MAVATFHDPITQEPRFAGRYLKPSFRYGSSTTVIVPGSSASPSYFTIGGRLYQSFTNLTLTTSVSGVGGLRTGLSISANTLYYLYAVANSKTLFLIADTVAPTTGLTGYATTSWTYLGAFATIAAGALPFFTNTRGNFLSSGGSGWDVITNNATPATAKTLLIPSTATLVYCRLIWGAVAVLGDSCLVGPNAAEALVAIRATSTTAGNNSPGFSSWPTQTASTLYTNVTTATTDSCTLRPLGFTESPSEFQ